MKKVLLIAGGMALLSGPAFAQNSTKHKAATTQHAPIADTAKEAFSNQGHGYGTAGCGLGSMAFGNKPGMIQVVAVTVNNILSPQTFAITSGTSGCGHSATSNAALYIQNNRVALERDAARGDGETLSGLAHVYGCQDGAELGTALQRSYPEVFAPTHSPEAMSQSIQTLIHNDAQLAKACLAQRA